VRQPSNLQRAAARVIPAGALRTLLQDSSRNHAPSYAELSGPGGEPGITLPDFIIEEVLACRAGYVTENFDGDPGIERVFAQRNAPIAAALLIDIDLPEAVVIEAQ
jgi:hypothetical protein